MCALASLRLWEAVDCGDFLAARRLLLLASNIDAHYPLVRAACVRAPAETACGKDACRSLAPQVTDTPPSNHPTHPPQSDYTALGLAALRGYKNLVRLLLGAGASVRASAPVVSADVSVASSARP